ncbi:helix-turn-helix transcriptional regulator [Weissella diestrammenae]|uniref:Helix-turn-helix transcriptional regulator n=1 Tax=Weissella diestrammenae TaxID=1162633 RepID=A0A7G9T3W9_9LACO|nr:helix-turn-helix transcriptional regulator [Weissella diestrammenae]MCM0582119.1 helix-turn-helix transcriptional regulator [Weissella diestrammenae]QNN74794.1 helix-turn-helix transcriptional regulator [Weissella diestrammenae]
MQSDEHMTRIISQAFKTLRKQRQMSLKALSFEQTTPSYISNFEHGQLNISLVQLSMLLEKLDCGIEEWGVRVAGYKYWDLISQFEYTIKQADYLAPLLPIYLRYELQAANSGAPLLFKMALKLTMFHHITQIETSHHAEIRRMCQSIRTAIDATNSWSRFEYILLQAYLYFAPPIEVESIVCQLQFNLSEAKRINRVDLRQIATVLLAALRNVMDGLRLDLAEQIIALWRGVSHEADFDTQFLFEVYQAKLMILNNHDKEALIKLHTLRHLIAPLQLARRHYLIAEIDQVLLNMYIGETDESN